MFSKRLFTLNCISGNPWTHVKDGRSAGTSGHSGHKGHQLLPDAHLVRVSRGRTAAIKCHLPRYADTGPNLTVSFFFFFLNNIFFSSKDLLDIYILHTCIFINPFIKYIFKTWTIFVLNTLNHQNFWIKILFLSNTII